MLSFRPATSNDSAGMKELQEMSIQAGIIQTQIKLRVEDANTALKADRPGSQTFLAYLGEATTPVGTISGWPHLACYGDGNEPTQAVLVYRLAVHPEYRKRGIAKALWQELNSWIKTTYGEEVLTYGYFQKGNEASQAWFRSIGGIFTQREVTLAPIKTLLAGKVKVSYNLAANGYTVRKAEQGDLEGIVEGLNNFYRGYDFYSPESVEGLKQWLEPRLIDGTLLQVSSYYVLEKAGAVRAGVGIFHLPQLFDVRVVKMPMAIKVLNLLLKVVPANGSLASSQASKIWYNPQHLAAAREFWQEVRQLEKANGNSLLVNYDKKGELPSILDLPGVQPSSHNFLVVLNRPERLKNTDQEVRPQPRPIFYL